jgi:hypothetical protein
VEKGTEGQPGENTKEGYINGDSMDLGKKQHQTNKIYL